MATEGYRLVAPAKEGIDADALVDFWVREGALTEEVARGRVDQVLLVALAAGPRGAELAGVSTGLVALEPRLGLELWHVRVFTAPAHRRSRVGWNLLMEVLDELERRHESGEDRRASGLFARIENQEVRRVRNRAAWRQSRLTFIGEDDRGRHLRVRYFPGAQAPPPPPG